MFSKSSIDYKKTFTEEITSLDAKFDWGEVQILPTIDSTTSIEAKNVPETFIAKIVDGVLKISFNYNNNNHIFSTIKYRNTCIVLRLPIKSFDKIILNIGSGNTKVENLKCNNYSIRINSGNLKISAIEVSENMKVDIVSGNMDINNCTLGYFNSSINSGNLIISGNINGNADIINKSGNINLFATSINGILNTDIISGNVKLSDCITSGLNGTVKAGNYNYCGTVNGNINVKVGSGTSNLKLTNPESDFERADSKYSINLRTSSGNTSVPYNN